jgi:glycosyltransferase involved in cell wall biosynthesis
VNVSSTSPSSAVASGTSKGTRSRPLLTVVVPVYNGGDDVVANIGVIHEAVAKGLPGEHVEIVVVSDGSIDGTAERLLETREQGLRVIHYDRNLGKGYAVKSGTLASHGAWVALVDADLDLDPASIPTFLATARDEELDFVIGSKRHPDSVVHYPRSRRIASWCYQRLNRVLFRLDVRDTQVGLKVFSRDVADDVIPILLVKQFAFDLELLAVGASLGYGRIAELPVRLEYRFTGSGVGSVAVLRALWDTAAIFYRLRILRTYARRRRLLRAWEPDDLPLVSVVGGERAVASLDYPRLSPTEGDVVAVVAPGARPAGNWLSATIPYFADADVAAVVAPTVAPLRGPLRERVAAAVLESRLGSGSRRLGYLPGNVREVADCPADSVVIRSADHASARAADVDGEHLVAWLAERDRRTIYTPDTSISAPPAPLVAPHLAGTFRHARARGSAARRSRGGSLSLATALSLAPFAAALVGLALVLAGESARNVGYVFLLAYAAVLCLSGVHAAFRFHSLGVGLLQPFAVIASQVTYLVGFVRGVSERSPAR